MGLMIGGSNSNVRRIILKNADGSSAGSISITSPSPKKKKRLQYNFKQISTQIMRSKTSGSARQVVSKARQQLATLQRNVKNDDYDETELRNAIIHAQKMERIAQKRMKHLKQEEELEKNNPAYASVFEEEMQDAVIGGFDEEAVLEMSEEDLRKLMEDLKKAMEEAIQESDMEWADSEAELALAKTASDRMDEADLELLKKKHRSEELREIMEADMKYLKAVFDKLAKEKQELSSGGSRDSGAFQNAGVSLELGGVEMPVQAAEAPVAVEGGNFDTMT